MRVRSVCIGCGCALPSRALGAEHCKKLGALCDGAGQCPYLISTPSLVLLAPRWAQSSFFPLSPASTHSHSLNSRCPFTMPDRLMVRDYSLQTAVELSEAFLGREEGGGVGREGGDCRKQKKKEKKNIMTKQTVADRLAADASAK